MRLLEVDLGAARDILAVLQGQADRKGQTSEIPFAAVKNLLNPFSLAINTPDALIALKNMVDPAGDVISDILDNGTVVLNTKQTSPVEKKPPAGSSPTVDQMAKRNAKTL